jgi:hypothetical protein
MQCLRAFWSASLLAILAACAWSSAAPENPKPTTQHPEDASGDLRNSLPLNDWLSQGERKAFASNIRILGPSLTFQQRHHILVRATFPTPSLQKGSIHRDLHFFIKVADESGKWFDGETYNHFPVEKKFEKKVDLVLEGGLYLQPGTYTIAVVVYDAVLREHNVAFRHVRVRPPKHDALPELLSAAPTVEFPPDPVDGVASPASGHSSLPVKTDRPVELDVIVDLTPYAAATTITAGPDAGNDGLASIGSVRGPSIGSGRGASIGDPDRVPNGPRLGGPSIAHRTIPSGMRRGVKVFQSRLLEAASVLSDIDLKKGCTRVTVFNALSRRTVMTAQPALSADWLKTWNDVMNTNLDLVSVDELAGSVESAKFFSDQVEKLMSQPPECNASSVHPLRVLTLFSHGAHFPDKTVQARIQSKCDCKVFYMREHEDVMDFFDDLHRLLAPLSVTRVEFSDPGQYRHKIAHFMKTLQELGAD